jgi:alpha-N-arabinofuranosidase
MPCRRSPLWLTEASTINGDLIDFPAWTTSASHAAYMATLWGDWIKLNIPWGMGDDLLWGFDRAVLGPAPDYSYTADAVTRQALVPMFNAGGRELASSVTANRIRNPGLGAGSYRGLAVTATRGATGQLFVLVVNRLPNQDITAKIQLAHFQSSGSAVIRHVASNSFQDWNRPGEPPAVTLETSTRRVGSTGFTHTFPATSTTVIRVPPA